MTETPDLPIPEEARWAAFDALKEAGYIDPDDGTIPRWRGDEPVPIWTRPTDAIDLVLAAALPHLRSLQVETQVRAGYAIGRKEAAEEIAEALEAIGRPVSPLACAAIARDIGKGDSA